VKYSFFDVYPGSAHPEILRYLLEHNLDHFVDPGEDTYTELGAERIKQAFGLTDVDIHYLPNGTISNVTALSSMLRPFEAVICPTTGHINNYEAGAFEATGHKIIQVDVPDGKLTPTSIAPVLDSHEGYMMVRPRVVYLTNITEEGTVYSKDELTAVVAFAKNKGLYTYLDGARLGMALASKSSGITLKEFGQLGLDMFYIGGTKNGGLYGEALVIKNDELKVDFQSYMKRQGASMGKPRPISLQFARFFDTDNLYLWLAGHANEMGEYLRKGLTSVGVELVDQSDANHAFVIMKDKDVSELAADFDFDTWGKWDETTTKIRLVCGWFTKTEDVDRFLHDVRVLTKH
jgi:threonine aldolase